MFEFVCIGRKTGKTYRRMIAFDSIESIAETPNADETVLVLKGQSKRFWRNDRYVFVAESYDRVKKRIEKERLPTV